MAVPSGTTIDKLQGQYALNKKLSDDSKEFFTLQGVNWVTRKAIGLASVKLTFKTYKEGGVTHIDNSVLASGLSTTPEARTINWTDEEFDDKLFGKCKGKSRFFKGTGLEPVTELDDADKKFLLGETLVDGSASSFADDDHLQNIVTGLKEGWTVDQVWGFENVDGAKRYTRRLVLKHKGKTEKIRLVYDYIGA